MNLHDIGINHRTDKAIHVYNGQSLLQVYQRYFSKFRDWPINLLEIGVFNGCSLRTWKEYFFSGYITGVDINPDAKTFEEDRIKIIIADQSESMENVKSVYDIIIDDGSHVNEYTIKTFNQLWPCLRSGGYYIIEDTHCTYLNLDESNVRENWPGMKYNKPGSLNNKREDFEKFILEKIQMIDYEMGISSIHFHANTCIMEKA